MRWFYPHLASLVVIGVCVSVCEAQTQSRSIEFSSPKDKAVSASLLKQLGKDTEAPTLNDPFHAPDSFLPQNSVQGVIARPAPQTQTAPALTQRQKELLEKKRNWAFLEPEEMISGTTEDDIFNLKKMKALSDPNQNLSPVEAYYQRQFEKNKTDDKNDLKKPEGRYGRLDSKSVREKTSTEELLGRITDSQNFQPDAAALYVPKKNSDDDNLSGYNNPFSSANYGLDAPPNAHQARMDVYRKLYGLAEPEPAKQATVAGWIKPEPVKKTEGKPEPFYNSQPTIPPIGYKAPTAPTKPWLEPVITKVETENEKQNPLFVSPSMVLPKRRF